MSDCCWLIYVSSGIPLKIFMSSAKRYVLYFRLFTMSLMYIKNNMGTRTNRKSTTCFPTNHKWTVYVTPKSPRAWHKTWYCFFASKIQLLSKDVWCKVCVKTSRDKVVATSFLYLTVYIRIAEDVPVYLKFALKVTHPFRKRKFRQILLNSAWAVRAKKTSSIIANRKATMHFPQSQR